MAIQFLCECGKHLSAPDELAGRRVRCPSCQKALTVPVGQGRVGGEASRPAPAAAPPAPKAPPPPPTTGVAPPPVPPQGLWAQRAHRARYHRPRDDEAVRSRGILWLGITLLAGFLLPVVVPTPVGTQVVFPNFLVLGEEGAPFLMKFMCLYPGLAGIAVMVMAYSWSGVGRSVTLMALGLFPIALLLADERMQQGLRQLAQMVGPAGGAVALFGLLGVTGLFAGSRARSFCPASRLAAVIGAAGAGLWVLSLLIPARQPGFRSGTSLGLIQPFELLGYRQTAMLGLAGIVSMALGISACVLCLINVREGENAEPLARLAFRLLIADLLVSAICGLFFGMTMEGGLPGEAVVPVLFIVLKMSCWVMGILLLTPVGLTDLIINVDPGSWGSPGGAQDPSRRILRFQQLLREGLMTPEEFERKKAEILSGR